MQSVSIRTAAALAAAAALLLAGAAAPARAQGIASLGIAAGATIPTSNTGDAQETGFHATIAIGSQPPLLPIGFRAEGTYNQFTAKSSGGVFSAFFPNADLRVMSVTGNVLLSPPSMLARPYVIGGLGYYNINFKNSPLDSEGKLGFNAGVGAKFSLTGFSTYAEVRYHRVNRDDGNIAYVPVTFGIMF